MTVLKTLIEDLPTIKDYHVPSHPCYQLLHKLAREEVNRLFPKEEIDAKPFGLFGDLTFPYFKMGAIDSLNLFALDELIIFSFYWHNRNKYKKVLDIGGNIGLHSIVMNRCGFDVKVYEPDPIHFEMLKKNLTKNKCSSVTPFNAAVSYQKGTAEFVRVLGNTTSSHILGSKKPYGELETFKVDLHDIKELLPQADLLKMDVEGHEKDIILATDASHWKKIDALLEVGSKENAAAIFEHMQKIGLNGFSQKIGWKRVEKLEDVPTSHKEGTLFLTKKTFMPWG